jgi:hypothetical protein
MDIFKKITSASTSLYNTLLVSYPLELHHNLQTIYNLISSLEKIVAIDLLSPQDALHLLKKICQLKDENAQEVSFQSLNNIQSELQKILQKFQENNPRCKIILLVEQTLCSLQLLLQKEPENYQIEDLRHRIQSFSPEKILSLSETEARYALKTLELFQRNTKLHPYNQKNYEILNNLKLTA